MQTVEAANTGILNPLPAIRQDVGAAERVVGAPLTTNVRVSLQSVDSDGMVFRWEGAPNTTGRRVRASKTWKGRPLQTESDRRMMAGPPLPPEPGYE
jgi:hypothetical protein